MCGTHSEVRDAAERRGVAPIDHAPDSPAITAIERLVSSLAKL